MNNIHVINIMAYRSNLLKCKTFKRNQVSLKLTVCVFVTKLIIKGQINNMRIKKNAISTSFKMCIF